LTGITVDGTSLASFRPGSQEADIQAANNPALVMGIPYNSSLSVAYRQPSGSGSWAVAENGFSVPVPGSVDILVYRRSAGTNDSRRVTYTLNLIPKSPSEEGTTQWDQVSKVNVTLLREDPSINYYRVKLELTIASSRIGQYEFIRYNGADLTRDSVNPEVWSIPITFSVRVDNENYTSHIGVNDIQFIPYGSGPSDSLTEIPGTWDDPIVKVEYRITRSDPSINYYRKEFVVTTDPAKGTFTQISVKNAAATFVGNNTWTVSLTESTENTVLDRSEVASPDFAPTTTPPQGDGELIEGTPSFYYNSIVKGYMFYVNVVSAEVDNVEEIEVTFASEVIASKSSGTVSKSGSNYNQYNGMLIGENWNEKFQNGGRVTFTVTTKDGNTKSGFADIEN
jgi:hypothetical protein